MESLSQAQDWRAYDPEYEGSTDIDDDETRLDPEVIEETSLSQQKKGKEKAVTPEAIERSMTVNEVSTFLHGYGIPPVFCSKFEENYIDGEEFLSLTEADIKSMVPPIGLSRKIYRLVSKNEKVTLQNCESNVSATSPVSSQAVTSPTPSLFSSGHSSSREGELKIPDRWRPEVELAIKDRSLNPSVRNSVIRTLASHLFEISSKPSTQQCEEAARKLILKYPFFKDDLGNGYQSWSDKMVERIRNVIKHDTKKAKRPLAASPDEVTHKRMKKSDELLRRYPVSQNIDPTRDDEESFEEHKKAINKELSKSKPRDTILLPLMKSTFNQRRMFILNEATNVQNILGNYPTLCRPSLIEQELGLIVGISDVKAHFMTQWLTKYMPALLTYAENCSKRNVFRQLNSLDESDDVSKQRTALKVLSECLGRGEQSLCYVYDEFSAMESVEAVSQKPPKRTQPYIAALVGEEDTQYVVLCEGKSLCKAPTIQASLFIVFACYYVFHLAYPAEARNILSFFQDYILGHPDSNKKSASYIATVSDIKRNL